jgi:hypothetical protein
VVPLAQLAPFQVASRSNDDNLRYHDMFVKLPASSLVPHFETLSQVLPWDVLRRRIMGQSNGPETFLTARNEFARSLAVFSMAGYGKRHRGRTPCN